MKVIEKIASLVKAIQNCEKSGNEEWRLNHLSVLNKVSKELLPSGSGFDNGSSVVLNECKENRIVFSTMFHHMDEHGGYDGWTEHRVTVKPDFVCGLNITVSGKDRNGIKSYIQECFYQDLTEECSKHKDVFHTCPVCGQPCPDELDGEETPSWECSTCKDN